MKAAIFVETGRIELAEKPVPDVGPNDALLRICPNFNSYAAQDGAPSQDGSYLVAAGLCGGHGYKATAGWRFGNLIDGTQAEYVLVPDAQANLALIPDGLTDE